MKRFVTTVLGTEYEVRLCSRDEDETLSANDDMDGYCDTSVKRITVLWSETDKERIPGKLADIVEYRATVLRHEIVHAFMFESGLDTQNDFAKNEELVDWIALQIKKMSKSMRESEAGLRKAFDEWKSETK